MGEVYEAYFYAVLASRMAQSAVPPVSNAMNPAIQPPVVAHPPPVAGKLHTKCRVCGTFFDRGFRALFVCKRQIGVHISQYGVATEADCAMVLPAAAVHGVKRAREWTGDSPSSSAAQFAFVPEPDTTPSPQKRPFGHTSQTYSGAGWP